MKEIVTVEPNKSNNYSIGLLRTINQDAFLLRQLKISSSRQDKGDTDCYLNWGTNCQYFNPKGPAFIYFSFDKMAVSLTNYSLKLAPELCFSKNLNSLGINGDKTYILHYLNMSNICKPEDERQLCNASTILINSVNIAEEQLTGLLLSSEVGSCSTGNHVSFNGIEFFGTLYKIPRQPTCKMNGNSFKTYFIFYSLTLIILT